MYKKYHSKFQENVLTIFAGEYYISNKGEVLSTVLGSCVAVCLFDAESKIGGMNHFMLPERRINNSGDIKLNGEELMEKSLRYGVTSMEILIAGMQKKGAQRSNLRAKIFGGGRVVSALSAESAVGDKNIGFTRAFLKSEGIPLETEDVGRDYGRKIFFLTGDNKIFVKKVELETAIREEREYLQKIITFKKKENRVTLF